MYKWWVCIILKFFEYIKKQYKLYIDPNNLKKQSKYAARTTSTSTTSFFYTSIKFSDIFTKTQFNMSALEHARSMCGPIPWFSNASEEGNRKKVHKPIQKNYKRPEKERKGRRGIGWLTQNQTKGAYNIGMRKKKQIWELIIIKTKAALEDIFH
jgi:hypothetical protein